MTEAGPAIPVIVVTDRSADAGPALRVAVVSDGRPIEGGPARPVIVVSDGRPTQGNVPLPVVLATGAQASRVLAGPAIPVVVVSGQLVAPVNTVLPVISGGTAAAITTTDGTWTGSPTFTYQWKRNGVAIGGATANAYTIVTADIGTTITVTVTATNAGGSTSATSAGYSPTYTQKVIALGPIQYLAQAESSGAVAVDDSGNGRNGAYTAVTLAQPGIGDGRTSASFDGATSVNNIYGAGLAGAFNSAEGTIAVWMKVANVGVWADGILRRLFRLRADVSNDLSISKNIASGELAFVYTAGGTAKSVVLVGASPTAYAHYALTWNKAADQLKAYINGAQVGTTQTGLGTWVGALASTLCVVGAGSTAPVNVTNGSMAHAAVFARTLSATEVLSMATA